MSERGERDKSSSAELRVEGREATAKERADEGIAGGRPADRTDGRNPTEAQETEVLSE